MEKDWVKIFASNKAYRSEIIKGMLEENGVNAVLVNRQASAFQQMLPGMDEVYVHISQKETAEKLIHESGEENIENNV